MKKEKTEEEKKHTIKSNPGVCMRVLAARKIEKTEQT